METVRLPIPSQNVHFSGNCVYVCWGLACLRVSLLGSMRDPESRLRDLLKGVENGISPVRVLSAPTRFFVNLKKMMSGQSKPTSFKSLADSVVDLSKKSEPFKALSELLTRSLDELKGWL